jgi:Uma2 family endonuclease
MPVSLSEPLMQLTDERFARFTADEYQEFVESGMLREGPIELLDGILVWKDRRDHGGSIMTVGLRHSNCVSRLYQFFTLACAGHVCHARSQQPIRVSPQDVPEPDVMILKGEVEDYSDRQAVAADAVLVIEVADSSLKFDREDKLRKYATAGIGEYWIVNLLHDRLEVYTAPDPNAASYGTITELAPGDKVTVTLPDGTVVSVDVARILF